MDMAKMGLVGAVTLLIAMSAEVLWQQKNIDTLKAELAHEHLNAEICSANAAKLQEALNNQNEFIESLEHKIEVKAAPKFENVIIKDNTCEAELQAYKDLFRELAR